MGKEGELQRGGGVFCSSNVWCFMGLLNILHTIEKELDAGHSRTDVFKKYTEKNPGETAKYAYMIASIPYPDLRKKYVKLNAILFLLVLALPSVILLSEWPINFAESTLFLAITLLVPCFFAYFIFQFHGGVYRLLGAWCLIDLLESLMLLEFTTPFELAKLALLVLIVTLSFYLGSKVFSNLKFLGPRQDESGRYLL